MIVKYFYYQRGLKGLTPVLNELHPNTKGAEKQKPKLYYGLVKIDMEAHPNWTLKDFETAYPYKE